MSHAVSLPFHTPHALARHLSGLVGSSMQPMLSAHCWRPSMPQGRGWQRSRAWLKTQSGACAHWAAVRTTHS